MARLRTTSAALVVALLCLAVIGAGYWALDVILGGRADAGDLPLVVVVGSTTEGSTLDSGAAGEEGVPTGDTEASAAGTVGDRGRIVVGTGVRTRQAWTADGPAGGPTPGEMSAPPATTGGSPVDGQGQGHRDDSPAGPGGAGPPSATSSSVTSPSQPPTTATTGAVDQGQYGRGQSPTTSGGASTSGTPPTSAGNIGTPQAGDIDTPSTGTTAMGSRGGGTLSGGERHE